MITGGAVIGAVGLLALIAGNLVGLVPLLFGGLFSAVSWRLSKCGLYVSDEGAQIRAPFGTNVVWWGSVLAVRTREASRGFTEVRELCFDLRDGSTVEAGFWGAARGRPRPWRYPDVLSEADFDRILGELRQQVALHHQP